MRTTEFWQQSVSGRPSGMRLCHIRSRVQLVLLFFNCLVHSCFGTLAFPWTSVRCQDETGSGAAASVRLVIVSGNSVSVVPGSVMTFSPPSYSIAGSRFDMLTIPAGAAGQSVKLRLEAWQGISFEESNLRAASEEFFSDGPAAPVVGPNTVLTMVLMPRVATAESSVPQLFNYQGRLTEASGRPLSDGVYGIKFTIWSDETGSDANATVWSQELPNVAVIGGVFNVILGAGSDLTVAFSGKDRFLGLTITRSGGTVIENAKELLPRQQILSVPFAFRAGISASVLDGSITSSKIAPGAVGSGQLANGAVGTAQLAPGAIGFFPNVIKVYDQPGSFTWSKPSGVSRVYVKVIGAGGRGGSSGAESMPRGGGGGGGYAEGVVVVTGDVAVTVGAVNSFGPIQATAGANASEFRGGAGGTGSGGSINLPGGDGQSGSQRGINVQGGMGGASVMGAGGAGGGFDGSSSIQPTKGAKFGGGGGGATNIGTGGMGDPGAVIVYY